MIVAYVALTFVGDGRRRVRGDRRPSGAPRARLRAHHVRVPARPERDHACWERCSPRSTAGVVALGIQGVAFMGGWLEQVSGFSQSTHIVTLGVITSLIMPSESLWRRAAYEHADPARGIALLLAVRERLHPEPVGRRICGGVRPRRIRRWRVAAS